MSEQPPPFDNERYNVEDEQIVGSLMGAENTAEMEEYKERLASRIAILRDYEQHLTPTFTSYANIVDQLLDKTRGATDKETIALQKLAEGRVSVIRSGIRRYIESVVKFQHVKKRFLHGGAIEDIQDEMIRIDRERKSAHDSLIETLRETGRVIARLQQIAKEETGEGVHLKGYPSQSGDKDGEYVFETSLLDDRDRVRDWAIAAWAIERIAREKKKAAEVAA